jgi:cyclopropane fatty-acyl-phospholipid synthase-like methyltransferase
MLSSDNNRLQKFYKDALSEYGDRDARSVHWSSQQGQLTRFLVLSQIANLNNQKVLDVGCGLGDLYQFFLREKIDVNYTGIDIVPNFILRAQERFPSARFDVQNIEDLNETFDFILASGALSFKVSDYKNFYFSIIKKMYDHARKGVAFNMLNFETHVDDDTYAAYHIEEVQDFCKTFCNDVQVVVDYLPQDFTIYLYK